MTDDKLRSLRDRALEAVLRDTELLELGSEGPVPLLSDLVAPPNVGGAAFELVDFREVRRRANRLGQFSTVRVRYASFDRTMTSVPTTVRVKTALSDARVEQCERPSCERKAALRCARAVGDWECTVVEVDGGTDCHPLAFDRERWREIPALDLGSDGLQPLWDRVFAELTRTTGFLEGIEEPIPFVTRLSRFVRLPRNTRRFRLADRDEAFKEVDAGERSSFLRLERFWWRRGPVRVSIQIDRVEALCKPLRKPGILPCTHSMSLECTSTPAGFECETDVRDRDCDPPPDDSVCRSGELAAESRAGTLGERPATAAPQ